VKLNGQPLAIKSKIDSFISFLETLPDDEVLTISEVVKRQPIQRKNTLKEWANANPRVSFYSYQIPTEKFWVFGNPRAIIAVRKQTVKTMGGK
jgi:hypothetical protein